MHDPVNVVYFIFVYTIFVKATTKLIIAWFTSAGGAVKVTVTYDIMAYNVMTYDIRTYEVMAYEVMTLDIWHHKYDMMTFDVITYDMMTHDGMTYDGMTHNVITFDIMTPDGTLSHDIWHHDIWRHDIWHHDIWRHDIWPHDIWYHDIQGVCFCLYAYVNNIFFKRALSQGSLFSHTSCTMHTLYSWRKCTLSWKKMISQNLDGKFYVGKIISKQNDIKEVH